MHKDRDTQRKTQTDTETQTEIYTDKRYTDRHTETYTETETNSHRQIDTDRQADIHTKEGRTRDSIQKETKPMDDRCQKPHSCCHSTYRSSIKIRQRKKTKEEERKAEKKEEKEERKIRGEEEEKRRRGKRNNVLVTLRIVTQLISPASLVAKH